MGLPSKAARPAAAFFLIASLAACHPKPQRQVGPPPAAQTLQRDIEAIVGNPALVRAHWGILVRSLRTDETIYALNAGKLLMPGSSLKILTLAAAAERLGWDYTYRTDLVAGGPIEGGALRGDLLVVGSGDPSITAASHLLETWADALSSAGIRSIDGRIVGDDNTFDDEMFGPGWTWEDLADRDGAGVSALEFNEDVAQAIIRPAPAPGMSASITIQPDTAGLVVNNRVTTTAAGGPPSIDIRRLAGSNRLDAKGSVPLGSEPVVRVVSVENPTMFFAVALRKALVDRGIAVSGPAVDIDEISDAPARNGPVLVTHTSAPLGTLAIRLMKNSQNLYAESLLKTIGAAEGTPTWQTSVNAERMVFESWGIARGDIVQVDGSGLSRYNFVTPEAVVAVLAHVDRDERLRGPFEASLPVAGRDGTLAARLKGTPAENNVRAKTGTLANARSMAGYVTTADGEPLVFAILANNYGSQPDAAVAAIDAIVARLASSTTADR